ncbi:hypothetical protein [Rhizobium wenxiniae]|uniref:hypothetical protein n=1 Tax=Rhizobium wenxiniae TaxID=1737357 RepID=UPI003C1E8EB0
MCEATFAAKAAKIIAGVKTDVSYPWLLDTMGEIRSRARNPRLKVTDMRGEHLEKYLDAQLQFLVEQAGLRGAPDAPIRRPA